jgi:proliferating cell nuclear antigen
MFEARLAEGAILKKLIDSIKDLVTSANFDCSSTGISLQAMDSSHVALVTLLLRGEGFENYRCDRTLSLGLNIESLQKILKSASADDMITMKAKDAADSVSFMFEHPKQTRISHFSIKLMDIDSEHLGIPDTEYKCTVKMSSSEFQRICRDLTIIGDTVKISASKEGVKFSVSGEMGNGNIICKQDPSVDEEDDSVIIKLEEKISLTFALRYLNSFAKATPLSKFVTLKLSPEVPLVVEYKIPKYFEKKKGDKGEKQDEDQEDLGYLRFYLAPKIEEEEGGAAAGGSATTEGGDAEE